MSEVIARAQAIALSGITGHLVEVEGAVSNQLPGMSIIGLADTALNEAKQRVRLACANMSLQLSNRFLTVNLSPAGLPKHGSGFDLAIALTCLAASGTCPNPENSGCVFIGELGLDGGVKHVPGLLTAVLAAKEHGFSRVMVAAAGYQEAVLVPGMEVIAVPNLAQAVAWLQGAHIDPPQIPADTPAVAAHAQTQIPDLSEIIGQPLAVRALSIAAAGKHNIAFIGSPGAGKTMLAKALVGILPPLSTAESLVCSSIAASCGQKVSGLVKTAPFVAPHHTASTASLIGASGAKGAIMPGDITRAHNGVLFLDEAPEFAPKLLDALRQPLESGEIVVQRARIRAHLPADFQLVIAANPCACGKLGDPLATAVNQCTCSPNQQRRYLTRISGPLTDRIDIRLRISRVVTATAQCSVTTSKQVLAQVIAARERQRHRFTGASWAYNSQAPGKWLRHADNRPAAQHTAVLDAALQTGRITMRGYDRVLRLAWTIADFTGKPHPERQEIAEALLLRGDFYDG